MVRFCQESLLSVFSFFSSLIHLFGNWHCKSVLFFSLFSHLFTLCSFYSLSLCLSLSLSLCSSSLSLYLIPSLIWGLQLFFYLLLFAKRSFYFTLSFSLFTLLFHIFLFHHIILLSYVFPVYFPVYFPVCLSLFLATSVYLSLFLCLSFSVSLSLFLATSVYLSLSLFPCISFS